MKKNVILCGVIGSVLIFGSMVCHAEKWDKNGYKDATVESGYYDADSIKVKGNIVSLTEKCILTGEAAVLTTSELSKHKKCRENIAKEGNIAQFQLDYQIERGKLEFRSVAKRYYNSANKLLCTNKDTGNDFTSNWEKIVRGSKMQKTQYDLVTKYGIKFQ